MSPTDYAQTAYARQNREAKALAIAPVAWECGVTSDDLRAWDRAERRALAKAADAGTPTDHDDKLGPTWERVAELLDEKAAWVAAHPPPPPAPVLVIPKGWPELVARHPPLTRPDARCCVCRRPAITASGHQWRCGDHPPQPGETGARLDWTPRYPPEGCGHGRCYCTRCPTFTPLAAPQAPRPDDLYR